MAPEALRELCVGTLWLEGFLCLLALGLGLISRRRLGERLGLLRGTLPASRWVWAAVGTLALSLALEGIIDFADWSVGTPLEEFALALAGADGADLALALLALGLAPGLAEELLCRGLVQRGLERRLGSVGAVTVGAVFFGVLHIDPVHGGVALVLGLYLGSLAARANSIWPAVFCHASNNLLAVYSAARFPELPSVGPLGICVSAAIALACLWHACRATPEREGLQIGAGSDDL